MQVCSYRVLQSLHDGNERFGIAVLQENDGTTDILREIEDISGNERLICQLVDRCNSYQLSECQVMDVIEDFLGML